MLGAPTSRFALSATRWGERIAAWLAGRKGGEVLALKRGFQGYAVIGSK
jgi:hypothetical protein